MYVVPAADPTDDDTLRSRYTGAITKFRNRHSTRSDRGAVRDLADVLERIRPALKKNMTRGNEGVLFDLANTYGIRHLDKKQPT